MTTQQKLDAALDARHRLMLGQSVVECEFAANQRVRYTQANADKLDAYIAELRAELAGQSRRGAVGFVF